MNKRVDSIGTKLIYVMKKEEKDGYKAILMKERVDRMGTKLIYVMKKEE